MFQNKVSSKEQADNLLKLAHSLEIKRQESPNKPPYSLNFLEYYNSNETTTSWILKEILNYHKGTNFSLLKSFIQSFLTPCGFNLEWIKTPIVTAEKERLDVRILEENNYAIIIENKIKGAGYQPYQIARYIQKMLNHGCNIDKIFVVIIPPNCSNTMTYVDEMDNDIWTLPDGEKYAESISKKVMKPKTVVIHKELIDWLLKQCFAILPKEEYVLKSAIIQFADYIKLLDNSRENQLFKSEMEDFVKKEIVDPKDNLSIKNWEEVENLKKVLSQIQFSICKREIEKWYNELLPDWGKYDLIFNNKENESAFYIEIKGVKCGCWSRSDTKSGMPYWGFTRNKDNDKECQDMVNNIAKHSDLPDSEEKNCKDFYKWNHTTNGISICKEIYQTALNLSLLTCIFHTHPKMLLNEEFSCPNRLQ